MGKMWYENERKKADTHTKYTRAAAYNIYITNIFCNETEGETVLASYGC